MKQGALGRLFISILTSRAGMFKYLSSLYAKKWEFGLQGLSLRIVNLQRLSAGVFGLQKLSVRIFDLQRLSARMLDL